MKVVHSWKPYPVYSGVELFRGAPEQGNKEKVIFQTGLTGSTGCVISYNPVHPVIPSRMKKPDKRRYRRFDISTHRKGREERKAENEDIDSSMGKNENNINTELVRTETNSSHSEFVRVSFSSLLMFILLHIFIVFYERSSEDKSK